MQATLHLPRLPHLPSPLPLALPCSYPWVFCANGHGGVCVRRGYQVDGTNYVGGALHVGLVRRAVCLGLVGVALHFQRDACAPTRAPPRVWALARGATRESNPCSAALLARCSWHAADPLETSLLLQIRKQHLYSHFIWIIS